MKAAALFRSACVLALIAACAPQERERTPAGEASTLGTLENAYNRTDWDWVRNPDARMLLKHRRVTPCFVDPDPPQDFADANFRVTRATKTIGGIAYEIVTAYDGPDFWEAVYTRAGESKPLLGVFAGGQCQVEAEKILANARDRGLSPARR